MPSLQLIRVRRHFRGGLLSLLVGIFCTTFLLYPSNLPESFGNSSILSFAKDGNLFLTGHESKLALLWDLETNRVISYPFHAGPVSSVAVSQSNRLVATIGDEKSVGVFSFSGTKLFSIPIDGPTSVRFLESKEGIVITNPYKVQIYSTSGKLWKEKEIYPLIESVAISKTRASIVLGLEDGSIEEWSYRTGKTNTLKLHLGAVTALAISPNGKYLASGGVDDKVILGNLEKMNVLESWKEHSSSIISLNFSEDSEKILSISDDGSSRIFAKGKKSILVNTDFPTQGSFGTNPNYVMTTHPDGSVHVYHPFETDFRQTASGVFWPLSSGKMVISNANEYDFTNLEIFNSFSFKDSNLGSYLGIESRFTRSSSQDLLKDILEKKNIQNSKLKKNQLEIAVSQSGKTGIVNVSYCGEEVWEDIFVYHNESILLSDAGRGVELVRVDSCQKGSFPVSLVENSNLLIAKARNGENEIFSKTIEIQWKEPKKTESKLYGEFFGISKYKNSKWNLTYPARDAIGLQESFLKKYNSDAKTQFSSLTNEKAPKKEIFQRLEALANTTKPNDRVILFFAGHGERTKSEFQFLAYDEPITESELKLAISKIPARNKFLILDTCYSGSSWIDSLESVKELTNDIGIWVVAASLPTEIAKESNKFEHGLLSKVLLDALKNSNITRASDLFPYIHRNLPDLTFQEYGKEQIPFTNQKGIDFLLTQ